MIYLAESGSTKCDAVILDDNGKEIKRLRTIGVNPYFHSSEFITENLSKVPEIQEFKEKITAVYFFGAGCSSAALNKIVAIGLQPVFPKAEIHVDHDLMSAAYSTYTGEPAITCILGTGSNCVYFDGAKVHETVAGLGFILGDEGSAGYIGKQLVRAFLYKLMPEQALRDFHEAYNLDKESIRKQVYANPNANVFLGNLAPFAHDHLNEPFFHNLVLEGFTSFIQTQVKSFPEAKDVPVHFVGSIAFHFKDVLKEAMDKEGLKMGKIIRRPIEGLIEYFRNHVLSKKAAN